MPSLVGSEMCIRDSLQCHTRHAEASAPHAHHTQSGTHGRGRCIRRVWCEPGSVPECGSSRGWSAVRVSRECEERSRSIQYYIRRNAYFVRGQLFWFLCADESVQLTEVLMAHFLPLHIGFAYLPSLAPFQGSQGTKLEYERQKGQDRSSPLHPGFYFPHENPIFFVYCCVTPSCVTPVGSTS